MYIRNKGELLSSYTQLTGLKTYFTEPCVCEKFLRPVVGIHSFKAEMNEVSNRRMVVYTYRGIDDLPML